MDSDRESPATPMGCSCDARGTGKYDVRVWPAQFLVDGSALRVLWEMPWTDRHERRVARESVAEIRVSPDDRLVAGGATLQLQIVLRDGEVIIPLRRRPTHEVEWVAARLQEWFAARTLLESRHAKPLKLEDQSRVSAPRTTGPLPAKTLHVPLALAQRPRNCRATHRPNSLIIQVGPSNPLFSWTKVSLGLLLFGFLALLMICVAIGITVRTHGRFFPTYLLIVVGLLILRLAGLGLFNVVRKSRSVHVLYVGCRHLRCRSKAWKARGATCWTSDRILRTEVIGVAVGSTSEQPPVQQLDVLLQDGSRIGWLTGRPIAELQWIAAELDANFARVPVVVPTSIKAWEASNVLSYESRRGMRADMTVGDLPDGGVLITIPPLRAERDSRVGMLVGPTLVMLFVIAMMYIATRGRFGGVWGWLAVAAAVAALGFIVRGIVVIRRGLAEPVVLSVDRQALSTNLPDRFRRYRHWPRERVADVRLTDRPPKGNKGSQPYVEIAFHGESSLFLCQHRGPEDRQRVIALLRAALGLPPLGPSM